MDMTFENSTFESKPFENNRRWPRRRLVATGVLAALLSVGCDTDGQSRSPGTAIGMSAPAPLLQARAIDRNQLVPVVRIIDGPFVEMQPTSETGWSGEIQVAPDREYQLSIVWIERIAANGRSRELPLARLEAPVMVGPDGALFTALSDDYDYTADDDGDGISNFDERVAGSDPFPDSSLTGSTGDANPSPDSAPDDDATGTPTFVPVPVQDPDSPPADVPGTVTPPPESDAAPTPAPNPPATNPEPEPAPEPAPAPAPETTDPVPDEPPTEETGDPTTDTDDSETTDDDDRDDESDANGPDTSAEADVLIRRIAREDAPGIDGLDVVRADDNFWVGEWANATQRDANGNRLLIDQLMVDGGTDEATGEAWRYWAAAHDGEYLYVLVVVDDDGQRHRDSPAVWNDDSLELFIDGDNSKASTYGADDFQRLIPLTAPGETRRSIDTGIVNGFFSSQEPLDIEFATGPGVGPRGIRRPRFEQDVYELRIELDSAGIVPGRPFGFELQVNDDDDGGNREAKWGWAHPARTDEDIDGTYLDPSLMGTALLE